MKQKSTCHTPVSYTHLYKEDGNVCCEDLDSTNGIKINGVKLNGKKNKKAVLKEGDCIKIGLEEFYFCLLYTSFQSVFITKTISMENG